MVTWQRLVHTSNKSPILIEVHTSEERFDTSASGLQTSYKPQATKRITDELSTTT